MLTASTDIASEVLDSFAECLTPEMANRVAAFRASPGVQARLDVLADQANEGELSEEEEEEQVEYERFLSVYHFVTILQAKARRFLKHQVAESWIAN